MATIPDHLLAKLNDAEAKLVEASDKDLIHDNATAALLAASAAEDDARGNALAAHQTANAAAAEAIADLKSHFGI